MLNRLSTCLFHPSYIGIYIKDHFAKIIAYFIFLLVLSTLPQMLTYANSGNFTKSTQNEIIKCLKQNITESNLEFNGTAFVGEGFYFEYEGQYFSFNGVIPETTTLTTTTFSFNNTSFSVLQGKITIYSTNYKEGLSSFKIADVLNNDLIAKNAFVGFIENSYNSYYKTQILGLCLMALGSNLLYACILVIFVLLLSGSNFNHINIKYKIKIILYSMTVYFVFTLLQNLYNLEFLGFLGFFLPYMYATYAISRLRVIEIPRK